MSEAAPSSLAQALFAPRTVALIGASGDTRKNTSRPQRFLRKHGYDGTIIPVNPGRDEVLGEKAYPDLAAVPQAVDQVAQVHPAAVVGIGVRLEGADDEDAHSDRPEIEGPDAGILT